MSLFKRPATHYGKSPEPETPYQRAAQVWDERIGSARVQARNWRIMAFGSLFLSAGFAAALVWQSARGTVVPGWCRSIGSARRSRRAGDGRLPADRSADRLASRPLHRAGPLDPGRSDHRAPELAARLRLDHRSRRVGAQRLCPHQRSLHQGRQAADRGRGFERHPRLGGSFRVAWTEALRERPARGTERWTAILTIVIQTPRDADRLRANPLGIYVNAINWSREMSQ
jgi:type IV secretion system protein VirB5